MKFNKIPSQIKKLNKKVLLSQQHDLNTKKEIEKDYGKIKQRVQSRSRKISLRNK
ncbi:MAG: hypothetical protein ACRCZW_07075 [Lactobacillaceae bacterium]